MSKDFFELELEAFVDDTYAPQLSAEPLQLEYDPTDRMSLEYSGFSLFGVNASEDGNLITVSGIQMRDMQRCIREYFGTSRIHSHMFTKMTWRSFSFFRFFAPEIYRICDLLIEWKASPSKSGYLMPRKTLQEIKEALLRNTWLGQTQRELTSSRLDKSKLKDLVLEPLDYQWEFFDVYDRLTQLYSMKGALLNAAPGAGKTYMGLSLFHILNEDVDHVVVVSPLQAVDEVWAENIRLRFKKEQTFWTSTGDKPLHKNYKYYIVHYQALENFVEWAKKNLKNKNNKSILDECHNFNDLTTLRTSTYVELCKELGISDSLWMSGTAIKALSIEAIPLLKCIDPFFTDAVMVRFKKIYSGATNAATALLRYRLDMISFKVEKKQLGLPTPSLIRSK